MQQNVVYNDFEDRGLVPLPKQANDVDVVSFANKVIDTCELFDLPLQHQFGPGLYIRELFIPAGVFVVGHHQATTHLNIMLTGRMRFYGEENTWTEIHAPLTFVAPPGRKVAVALEDTLWQNIYATDETDIDKLEAMFLNKIMSEEDAKEYELLRHSYSEVL